MSQKSRKKFIFNILLLLGYFIIPAITSLMIKNYSIHEASLQWIPSLTALVIITTIFFYFTWNIFHEKNQRNTIALLRANFLIGFLTLFIFYLIIPSFVNNHVEVLSGSITKLSIIKVILKFLILALIVLKAFLTYKNVTQLKSQSSDSKFFTVASTEKFIIVSFFIIAFVGGSFLGVISYFLQSKDDIKKLNSFSPSLPTTLYDVNGKIIAELFQHQRELVKLEDIPKPVVSAFLAVEDTNFYNHFGIDFLGIMRAMWANVKAMRVVQGGSTLTQQLVKGLYTKSEKTVWRKVYEAILALQVEKEFSKSEILEMYFNQIFFGHGAYGISSASKFYFDKPVQKLTIMEGSILAALPKAPHRYSPIRSPHRARKKNKIIIRRLVNLGYLTKAEAKKMYDEFWEKYWQKLMVTPSSSTIFGEKTNHAPYFTETVRQELVGLFGEDFVYSKGLKVFTTANLVQHKIAKEEMTKMFKKLDPMAIASNANRKVGIDYELMGVLNSLRNVIPLPSMIVKKSIRNDYRKAVKKQISDAWEILTLIGPGFLSNKESKQFRSGTREFKTELLPQGAFIAMEPKTGRISVMIGGRKFKSSDQFNRATMARRQPGSAFKPFVYGAALEDRAVHSSMGFVDAPLLNLEPDGSMWAPSNYEGGFHGYVTLDRALAMSLNIVSVQVFERTGPEKVIDFASRLTKAAPSRFRPDHSLALGSSEITPKEMLQGYSIIANEGKDVIPHTIIYVTDRDGNVIYNQEKQILEALNYKKKNNKLQVIEKGIAYIVRTLMQGVANFGTAAGSIRVTGGYRGPAAGKTGTTSAWNDAWFGGYTSDLAAVIWFGMDNGSMTLGRGAAGGSFGAPTWGAFMRRVYAARGGNPKPFDMRIPAGVQAGGVCADNGMWPNSECETPCKMKGTLIPTPIRVGNIIKRVGGEKWDCTVTKHKNFFDLIQEQNNITDDEIDKKKKFRGQYDGQ